jgi:hypothetical protein
MVGREIPVASETTVIPPHPIATASQAAQQRRTFSSITGFKAWYLLRTAAMISESTMKNSITVTHKLEKLFCDRSVSVGSTPVNRGE